LTVNNLVNRKPRIELLVWFEGAIVEEIYCKILNTLCSLVLEIFAKTFYKAVVSREWTGRYCSASFNSIFDKNLLMIFSEIIQNIQNFHQHFTILCSLWYRPTISRIPILILVLMSFNRRQKSHEKR
jgi:hypothetical protein